MASELTEQSQIEELKMKKKIQSSIPGLSVGSERKCFNQIRRCSEYITPETLLWNGMSVGEFCMSYVIGHHMKRKRKAEEKASLNPDTKSKKRSRTEIFNEVALFEQEEKKLTNATSDESLHLVKEDNHVEEVPLRRSKRRKIPEPEKEQNDKIIQKDQVQDEVPQEEPIVIEPVKKPRAKRKTKAPLT